MAKHRKHKRSSRGRTRQPAIEGLKLFLKQNWLGIRFASTSLTSIVAFFVLIRTDFIREHFVTQYSFFIAWCSRISLQVFGVEATGSGTIVLSPQFAVNVLDVCNGLEVTAIFFACVLGFPSSWRSKLIGLLLGYPVIFIVNQLRIVVLFFLGYKNPVLFHAVHNYYAQAFVILATLVIWLLWMSVFSAYGTRARPPAAPAK